MTNSSYLRNPKFNLFSGISGRDETEEFTCILESLNITFGFRYWRLKYVEGVEGNKCWAVKLCEMFDSKFSSEVLSSSPQCAFASSVWGNGFPASNAFDPSAREWGTASGRAPNQTDYLAYEFPRSVVIQSIRIVGSRSSADDIPTKMEVQASHYKFEGYQTIWTILNPDKLMDVRWNSS